MFVTITSSLFDISFLTVCGARQLDLSYYRINYRIGNLNVVLLLLSHLAFRFYLNDHLEVLDELVVVELVAQRVVEHEHIGTVRIEHEAFAIELVLAVDERELVFADQVVDHLLGAHLELIDPAVDGQLGPMVLDLSELSGQEAVESEAVLAYAIARYLGREVGLLAVQRVLDLRDQPVVVVVRLVGEAIAQLKLAHHVVEQHRTHETLLVL